MPEGPDFWNAIEVIESDQVTEMKLIIHHHSLCDHSFLKLSELSLYGTSCTKNLQYAFLRNFSCSFGRISTNIESLR